MTQTAHLGVRDAIVTLLQTAPAIAGGRIVANRRRPMAQAVDTQVFVYLEESQATRAEIAGNPTRWDTRIRVECVARDVSGTASDAASDALQQDVCARILGAPSLSGKAIDAEITAIAWTEDEADTTVSSCQALYSIWHQTQGAVISA